MLREVQKRQLLMKKNGERIWFLLNQFSRDEKNIRDIIFLKM